jgi:serine/threonine-protein kinase
MQLDEALKLADRLVLERTGSSLSDAQRAVFSGSWRGQTYLEIAEAYGLSSAYLNQEVGPQLWKLLSEACSQRVSKKNLHSVLEQQEIRVGDRINQDANSEAVKVAVNTLLEESQPSKAADITVSGDLSPILDRIASGLHTEADAATLRQLLSTGERQIALQFGKYSVNVGQGQDIHIGDRIYQQWDDHALQALVKAIQQATPKNVPTQFQSLIADKTGGFVGRKYVFDAIESFLTNNPKGYFTIMGDPGMGKSAILAKYVQDTGCIAHFNVQLQGPNRADQFLQSICTQLIDRYQLSYDPLPSNATRDGEFLGQLLDEVAQRSNGKPLVIVIDALDEVDSASYRIDANILYLPAYLPTGVYFIMTRRRDVEVPFTTYAPVQILSLLDYQTDSHRDVREYIQNRVNSSEKLRQHIDERQETVAAFTDKIVDKSENNFMYLRYVLQDIEMGLYQDLCLERFPQGLQGFYEFHWRRMGLTANPIPDAKIKIVYILGEVRQPVSRQQICDFSGEDAYTVQTVLNEWKQFLHELLRDNQKRYSVYHASFRDFLHRKDILEATGLTIPGIHQLIAKDQLNKWKNRHRSE